MKKKSLHVYMLSVVAILAGLISLNAAEARQGPQGRQGPPSSDEVTSHLFELYDADSDGFLSGVEIDDAAAEMLEHRPPCRGQQEQQVQSASDEDLYELEDQLMAYDVDGDSALSNTELLAAIEAMAPSRPERGGR